MDKKLSRLTTEQRYELVAYLDGELDAEATARIEKLIAENPVARQDVELLAATYQLVDHLPRPRATADFTEKTMAMARLDDVRPDVTQSPWYRRSQQAIGYIGWTAAMCAVGLVGFAVTRYWVPQPFDPLIENLEIIRDLHRYEQVGSVDFLEQLRSSGELMNEIRGATGANPTQ